MSRQTMMDSINLRHGAGRRRVYGGVASPTFGTSKTNQALMNRLKNQIHTVSFGDSFRMDASFTQRGWS